MIKLSVFSRERLLRLDEFNKPYFPEVWKFLDDLKFQQCTTTEYPLLTEPKSEIGKDCNAHVQKLMSFGKDRDSQEEADQCELEFIEAMKIKYPHHDWKPGRAPA